MHGRRRSELTAASCAVTAILALVLTVVWPLGRAALEAAVQPEAAAQPAEDAAHVEDEAHGEDAEHESGMWEVLARLVNFGILAGVLGFALRTPIATYLRQRAEQITADLQSAASTQMEATRQIEEIDRKLAALPGELQALKARGAEEVASEEARIRQAADGERERLLQQARREIEMRTRIARRELTELAAQLATDQAASRLRQAMTGQDHLRMVDQYMNQLREVK